MSVTPVYVSQSPNGTWWFSLTKVTWYILDMAKVQEIDERIKQIGSYYVPVKVPWEEAKG